jgi:hypothetical protein
VSRDEVPAEPLVVVHSARLAQRGEPRIGIVDERRIGRIEGEGRGGDLGKLDAARRGVTSRLQGGSDPQTTEEVIEMSEREGEAGGHGGHRSRRLLHIHGPRLRDSAA